MILANLRVITCKFIKLYRVSWQISIDVRFYDFKGGHDIGFHNGVRQNIRKECLWISLLLCFMT